MHTPKLIILLLFFLFSAVSISAGEIEVVKQVIGGNNNTFNISIAGNSPIPITDGGSTGFVTVTNGSTVSISENSNGLPQFTNITYQCINGLGNIVASGNAVRNSSSLASFNVVVPNSPIAIENQLTCTLFNIKKAALLLSKTTTNDDNTTAFNYSVNANGTLSTASLTGGGSTEIVLGKKYNGTVTITETLPLNWILQSSSCINLDGNPVTTSGTNPITVTLAAGDNVLCSFINTPAPGNIIIDKQTNPAGDTTAFSFTPDYGSTFTLSDADAPNDSGLIPPGVYNVSESLPIGWTLNSATCDDGSPVTAIDVTSGETVTCIFVNDREPTLTLIKTVVNDNGGVAVDTDFIPSIDGAATTWNTAVPLSAGTHTATESVLTGYRAGDWGGDCAIDGSITLALGQIASCTITNDDDAASLTLIKLVTNDNGGIAVITDFPLFANGAPFTSGAVQSVSAGTYALTETNVTGYTASDYSCVVNGGAAVVGNSLTVALGDSAVCTITNDDDAAVADLSITKTDAGTTYTPGGTFSSYIITVVNNGPDSADGSIVADALGTWAINPTWTCTSSGLAVCPNSSGIGSINETIATFPNGGQVVYVLSGTYSTDMDDY